MGQGHSASAGVPKRWRGLSPPGGANTGHVSFPRAILHAEDITARKRPRLSPRASPGHPRGTESPWAAGGGGGWRGPRAGRVTGLYAQLLRELEAEVGELQRALAARDEAVLHRDRRIRQLELENRQLRSHVRSLEEENDLLSSGDGHGGPLATAATATRMPLASGTGCIGNSGCVGVPAVGWEGHPVCAWHWDS